MGRIEISRLLRHFKKLKTGSTNAAGQITYLIHNGCLTPPKMVDPGLSTSPKGYKKSSERGI